jgi:acyl-CoA thioester hydrolase
MHSDTDIRVRYAETDQMDAICHSARYADLLTVRSSIREVKGPRVTIAYEVFRKPGMEPLAEGWTAHVFVGKDFRPVNMLRVRPDVYGKMRAAAEGSGSDA